MTKMNARPTNHSQPLSLNVSRFNDDMNNFTAIRACSPLQGTQSSTSIRSEMRKELMN
jgi:hypothetical protein